MKYAGHWLPFPFIIFVLNTENTSSYNTYIQAIDRDLE